MEFYKAVWGVITVDFMEVIKELQFKETTDWRTNCSFISLIPKKDQVGSPQDFIPISLVNNIYKIVSKILLQKLKLVLSKLIPENQGAFINDKQILDGILIAGELIDSRLKSGIPGVLCKPDIQKALNNVSWQTIHHILKSSCFGQKWINWVIWCVILLNILY